MVALCADTGPVRLSDETTYDILRDEWELLLAIGSGPTDLATVCERFGSRPGNLDARLAVLREVGLVRTEGRHYALVPAFHQRQEGMSSCVRDLLILRMHRGGELPLAYQVREGCGSAGAVRAFIQRLEREALPNAFGHADVPAGATSGRYTIVFAVATGDASLSRAGDRDDETTEGLVRLLRQAASERSQPQLREGAKLWMADVRIDEANAHAIADEFRGALDHWPADEGTGSAGFAVFEHGPPQRRSMETQEA